jgi:hypothetical protein
MERGDQLLRQDQARDASRDDPVASRGREGRRPEGLPLNELERAFVTALGRWAARDDYRDWRRRLPAGRKLNASSIPRSRTCDLDPWEYEEIESEY